MTFGIQEVVGAANAVPDNGERFIGVGSDEVIALTRTEEPIKSRTLGVKSLVRDSFVAITPTAGYGGFGLWVSA